MLFDLSSDCGFDVGQWHLHADAGCLLEGVLLQRTVTELFEKVEGGADLLVGLRRW